MGSTIKVKNREVFKSFLRIMAIAYKANKVSFVLFLLGITLTSTIPFAINFLDSKVIDEVISLLTVNTELRNYSILISIVVLVIALNILDKLVWALNAFFEKIQFFAMDKDIEFTFLKKISTLDSNHFEDSETNNLIQRCVEAYHYKPVNLASRSFWMVADIVRIVSSVFIVLNFSVIAFLVVIATTLPSLLINLKFGKDSWGIWNETSLDKRKYYASKGYLEKESSIMELRIFKTKDYILDLIYKIYTGFQKKERKNQVKRAFLESIFGNLSSIGLMFFWVILLANVLNSQITIGQLTFYLASINTFSSALSSIFRRLSSQYEDSKFLTDFFKFLDLKNTIVEGTQKLNVDGSQGIKIEFKDVWFKYKNAKRYTLKNFNLVINPKERIAFVGENGAGKSTLIKLLCRFYDVSKGGIYINDINIKDLTFDSLYSQIGVLFQDFIRYNYFDVKTNIELGDIDKINDLSKIDEALYKADAKTFTNEYKDKLNQILDKSIEGGINPSGGQWQRLALARAFFRNSPILILDEPTSAIDAKAEYQIFERLYKFAEDKTVLIVSHRFSTVRKANRIIVLEKGSIVEQGTHEELMKIEGGKYFEAFTTQAKGYL